MRISVVWSMLRYIVSSKINNKPLTYTKYDSSIIMEKIENWIGQTVHGPYSLCLENDIMMTPKRRLSTLIIYMKKLLDFDCLRAMQFFFKVQKRVNSVQKEVTNQAFWLVNDQRNSRMANQIFQIKLTPWMAQLMAQFFPDCEIRARFFCSTISKFFHVHN